MKITHGRRTDTGYDFCLEQFALEAVKDDSGTELVPFQFTVKGGSFKSPVVVTLQSETGEEVVVQMAADPAPTQSQFEIAIPADLKPGRWHVQVKAGGAFSNESEAFVIKPKSTS